jgi:hypothetical protein
MSGKLQGNTNSEDDFLLFLSKLCMPQLEIEAKISQTFSRKVCDNINSSVSLSASSKDMSQVQSQVEALQESRKGNNPLSILMKTVFTN